MVRRIIFVFALGFLGWVLLPASPANTEAADPTDPSVLRERGIEVLARGPVHEAFAEPYTGKAQAMPAIPNAPPKDVNEIPPDQKPEGDNVLWIPGYWQWDEERKDFIWVSGFWRKPPPDRRWVPGHWKQTTEGWQWTSGFWAALQQPDMNYLPQPPEPLETGPSVPAPADDYQYVPGTWLYRSNYGFGWRPGFWTLGRPGWVWCPARYIWTPGGFLFNDGYWDYLPEERGLLCAPVWFDRPLFRLFGWGYQPCYYWRSSCLLDSLFVRPGYCNYFFGDYYDPFYRGCGFSPWFGFRIGGYGCDPFYSYQRWNNRHDRNWDRGLHDNFDARVRGDRPRPPRNLTEQTTVVNNIQNIDVRGKNNQVNATIANSVAQAGKNATIEQVSVLSSLNRNANAKDQFQDRPRLQQLNEQSREVARMSAQELQQLGKERGRREGEVARTKENQIDSRPIRVELPPTVQAARIKPRADAPVSIQNDARFADGPRGLKLGEPGNANNPGPLGNPANNPPGLLRRNEDTAGPANSGKPKLDSPNLPRNDAKPPTDGKPKQDLPNLLRNDAKLPDGPRNEGKPRIDLPDTGPRNNAKSQIDAKPKLDLPSLPGGAAPRFEPKNLTPPPNPAPRIEPKNVASPNQPTLPSNPAPRIDLKSSPPASPKAEIRSSPPPLPTPSTPAPRITAPPSPPPSAPKISAPANPPPSAPRISAPPSPPPSAPRISAPPSPPPSAPRISAPPSPPPSAPRIAPAPSAPPRVAAPAPRAAPAPPRAAPAPPRPAPAPPRPAPAPARPAPKGKK